MEKKSDLFQNNLKRKITITEEDPNTPDAINLIDELSETLASITGDSGRNSFELSDVKVPRAIFVVARNRDGNAIGCGAFRPINENTAEIKRMYTKPKSMGVGTEILAYLEARVKEYGYTFLRLETRLVNYKAVLFYEKNGYKRIPNYGKYIGNSKAVCFEKCIKNI